GVARYFRKISGGRQFIEWRIFDAQELMTYEKKKQLASEVDKKGNTWLEIGPMRDAAKEKGIPADDFYALIWLIDDNNVSSGGTTATPPNPPDILLGARTLRPNRICHEMVHSLGLFQHAAAPGIDYGDNYFIMGGALRVYTPDLVPNQWLLRPAPAADLKEYSRSGPGICAPYLLE